MIHYKFRWLYILFINMSLLMLSYMYCLEPIRKHLHELKKTEQNFREDIRVAKLFFAQHSRKPVVKQSVLSFPQSEVETLHRFITQVHKDGLLIQAMHILPVSNQQAINEFLVHVIMNGDFQQLYKLVFELEKQSSALIHNFSFKWLGNDKLQLILDVSLLNQFILSESDEVVPEFIKSGFCNASNAHESDDRNAMSVPLSHMRMVGCVQQAQRKQALILLPNKTLLNIECGALLGKEKGVVTDILMDQTIIELSNKKKTIIKLSR